MFILQVHFHLHSSEQELIKLLKARVGPLHPHLPSHLPPCTPLCQEYHRFWVPFLKNTDGQHLSWLPRVSSPQTQAQWAICQQDSKPVLLCPGRKEKGTSLGRPVSREHETVPPLLTPTWCSLCGKSIDPETQRLLCLCGVGQAPGLSRLLSSHLLIYLFTF